MKAVNRKTKKLYDEHSNVRTLVRNFIKRCEDKGVVLIWRNGRKLSLARSLKSNWECLESYSTKVMAALITLYSALSLTNTSPPLPSPASGRVACAARVPEEARREAHSP
jgi:hypothetical protein